MASCNSGPQSLSKNVSLTTNEILLSAISSQDIENVKDFLESGQVTLNSTDRLSLCVACLCNSLGTVKNLVRDGADVNAGPNSPLESIFFSSEGIKPIHSACNGGGARTELVTCLVEAGSTVDEADGRGDTPLHIACRNGNVPLVQHLLKLGASVQKENYKRETPLVVASSMRNVELIKILLEAGSDPTALGGDSLWNCIHHNCPKGVELLFKASRSKLYDIGSHMTTLRQLSERTNLLGMDSVLDILASDNVGIPPLLIACSASLADSFQVVKTILEIGADIHEKDPAGFNCLQHACSRVNVKTVQVLLDYGVNPKDHSWDKLWKAFPPLHSSNAVSYLNLLKLLVASGFNIDEESERMFTGAVQASDLPDERKECICNFLTTCRTVPLSLSCLSRIKIRHFMGNNIDDKIGMLEDRIPLVLQEYLRFVD